MCVAGLRTPRPRDHTNNSRSDRFIILQRDFVRIAHIHDRPPFPLDPDADVVGNISPLSSLSGATHFAPFRGPLAGNIQSAAKSCSVRTCVFTSGVLSLRVCCTAASRPRLSTGSPSSTSPHRGMRRCTIVAAASTPAGRCVSDRSGLLIEIDWETST